MPAVILNIAIGLATSSLSASGVWAWRRMRTSRSLRGKAALFGLQQGGSCLIVMNHHWHAQGTTSHKDVLALVEVAAVANELANTITVTSADDLQEGNGDRTEFCIGGPRSNPRTLAYLATHLVGVTIRPKSTRRDSSAIIIGEKRFLLDHGRQDHALVARFTPPESSRPVILICGQSAVANLAAVHYLAKHYRRLLDSLASIDRFCLILRTDGAETYGHHATQLVADVSMSAFEPAVKIQPAVAGPA